MNGTFKIKKKQVVNCHFTRARTRNMVKRNLKKPKKASRLEIVPKDENDPLPAIRMSDDPVPKKANWINKQRVLVFAARGISFRDRHLMRDIKTLMPHNRPESKMERSKTLSIINNMCEMKHCNKAMLFEGRRKRDLYMWLSNVPTGPSVKFLVENVHTMGELKMTGNCLRGARPLLSFDKKFDEVPYLSLCKEMLVQTFGVPYHHPKSQPFVDHIYTFTFLDNRIWFRNFQILSEDGGLVEIGPRFVLNPVKIFEGSFTGNALWENPDYVSPSKHRQMLKKRAKDKYINRFEQKVTHEANLPKNAYTGNEYDEIFEGNDALENAKKISAKALKKLEKEKGPKVNLEEKIKKKQLEKVKELINKKRNKIRKTTEA